MSFERFSGKEAAAAAAAAASDSVNARVDMAALHGLCWLAGWREGAHGVSVRRWLSIHSHTTNEHVIWIDGWMDGGREGWRDARGGLVGAWTRQMRCPLDCMAHSLHSCPFAVSLSLSAVPLK